MAGDGNRDKEVQKIKLTAERPLRTKKPLNNKSGGYGNRSKSGYANSNNRYGKGERSYEHRDSRSKSYSSGKPVGREYSRDGKKNYKGAGRKSTTSAE